MKFFAPDLLLRFGSTDDATANAAHQEWEEANRKYLDHLKEIRPKLPRTVRYFLRHFCLHDAKLLILGMREDFLRMSLFLELQAPSDQGVLLTYELTKRATLFKHPSLSEDGTPIEWLYDEFNASKRGSRPIFTHSILFTGGRELRLSFRNLQLTVFEKMVMAATGVNEYELDALLVGA